MSGGDPDDRLDALPLSAGAKPEEVAAGARSPEPDRAPAPAAAARPRRDRLDGCAATGCGWVNRYGPSGRARPRSGRRWRRQGLRLAGLAAALMAVIGCGAGLDPVTGTSTAPVEIDLPLGLDAMRQRLGDLFAKGDGTAPARRLAPGDWLACFTLFDRRPPGAGAQSVFPSDAALRVSARGDAAMNGYLARGAEERAQDVFLYDARDCKWVSEYRARGRPVRFSCDFILHLEVAGAHATRLEALEVRPQVTIGSRLGFTAHGLGIGWVEIRRAVAPTRRDRVELLARIRGSLDDAAGVPPARSLVPG